MSTRAKKLCELQVDREIHKHVLELSRCGRFATVALVEAAASFALSHVDKNRHPDRKADPGGSEGHVADDYAHAPYACDAPAVDVALESLRFRAEVQRTQRATVPSQTVLPDATAAALAVDAARPLVGFALALRISRTRAGL